MTERFIQSSLAGLQYVEEATRGTDPAAGYSRTRLAFDCTFKPGQINHQVMAQKSSDHRGRDADIPGAESGVLSFKIPLQTIAGSESTIIALLKRMGAQVNACAKKDGDVTGGGADTIQVADADAAGLEVGALVHHNPLSGDSSIRGIIRVVSAFGTTTATVNQNFATAPGAGDTIEAFDTITPKGGEPDKYFTFHLYQGEGSTDRARWALCGCAGTWKLENVGPTGIAVISFEFQVDNWTLTEANLAQTDAAGNSPRSVRGANLLLDGSTLRSKSLAFNPGQALREVVDLNSEHGRQAHLYQEPAPMLDLEPLHDTAWATKWQAGTTHDVLLEDLVSDTDAWALWLPAVQVASLEQVDDGGLMRMKPPLEARDPGVNADDELLPIYAFGMTH